MMNKEMYNQEKLGALEAMLKMIAEKMSGEEDDEEKMSSPFGGKDAMGGEEEVMEEMMPGKASAMLPKEGDDKLDPEKIASFMKNRNFKKPEGVSARMISVTAKPRSKMKMKG